MKDIRDALRPYEILAPVDAFQSEQMSIVVDQIIETDTEYLEARVLQSPLPTLAELGKQRWEWGQLEPTRYRVRFTCAPMLKQCLLHANQALLYHYQFQPSRGEVSSNVLFMHPQADGFPIPWGTRQSTPGWYFDPFAGGYGGWHHATTFLGKQGLLDLKSFALDESLAMVMQHAVTHDSIVCTKATIQDLATNIPAQDIIVHARIQDTEWRSFFAMLESDLWCISAPCQPWSNSGRSRGFADENGKTALATLGLARVYRPKHLLWENVKGMKQHPHYEMMQHILKWCGYRVIHEILSEASGLIPVNRSRLLMLLERVEEPFFPTAWISWGQQIPVTPNNWQGLFAFDQHEPADWTLDHVTLIKYWEPQYRPPSTPTNTTMTQLRLPDGNTILPVFMAQYGRQHELPESHLLDKGLMGFFLLEGQQVRWFAPYEIALMHLHFEEQAFLQPKAQAWTSVGNMICIPHALLMLLNWLNHASRLPPQVTINELCARAVHQRLLAHQTQIHRASEAWYLGTREQIANMQHRLNIIVEAFGGDFHTPNHDTVIAPINVKPKPEQQFFNQPETESERRVSEPSATPAFVAESHKRTRTSDVASVHSQHSSSAAPSNTAVDNFVPIHLQIGHKMHGPLHVHHTATWYDLLAYWGIPMIITDFQGQPLERDSPLRPAIMHMPKQWYNALELPEEAPGIPLLLYPSRIGLKAIPIFGDLHLLQSMDPDVCVGLQDVHGHMSPSKVLEHTTLLLTHNDCARVENIAEYAHVLSEVRVETCVPAGTDTLQVLLRGHQHVLEKYCTLWFTAIPQHWLQQYGRRLTVKAVSTEELHMFFEPLEHTVPYPAAHMRHVLTVRLSQIMLFSLNDPAVENNFVFKYYDRRMQIIGLPLDTPSQLIRQLLTHAFVFLDFGDPPSIVTRGKTWRNPNFTTVEHVLQAVNCLQAEQIQCMIIRGSRGGAASTRAEFHRSVHSALAAQFIAKGMSESNVTEAVNIMIQQIGMSRLTFFLYGEPHAKRQQSFQDFCHMCGITFPSVKKQDRRKSDKMPKTDHRHQQKAHLDVTQYKLTEGFFHLESGEPAPITSEFVPSRVRSDHG